MHDDLDTIDWSFLIGKEVSGLSIWESQIKIFMTDDSSIDIFSNLEYVSPSDTMQWVPVGSERGGILSNLIGHSIKNATAVGDDALIIGFDNGNMLSIIMSHNGYESFSVTGPGSDGGIFV
jgi:hypothetical protein